MLIEEWFINNYAKKKSKKLIFDPITHVIQQHSRNTTHTIHKNIYLSQYGEQPYDLKKNSFLLSTQLTIKLTINNISNIF